MPTLFRFLMVLSLIVGSIAGGLYVLAEYFQPEPKEISKALRNVKVRAEEQTASTPAPAPSADAGETAAPTDDITGRSGGRRAQ
jgi:hypothetical protein